MSFDQIEFLYFFVIVLVAYWSLGRRVWQNGLLVIASAVFYGWVHPWFLFLLFTSAVADFLAGRAMKRWPRHKLKFLVFSLAVNLGMLGFFKYFDFFLENLIDALAVLGFQGHFTTLGIFLPVGISFYTFQTMSYSIDIYRGQFEPQSRFLDYLVFVSFFPQLVAGPVERARNLLPQMEKPRTFDLARFADGLGLALWGGFKKLVVADTVAPYVDKIFTHNDPSGAMVWAATLGFSVQILADFSGYTDIARGTAKMLGFELMENFRHPYLATTPSDFWRRWHISFSTWIRDYLYIPCGGSRGGFLKVLRATSVALLLSGLWHGARWNFVIWGAYHVVLLTAYRLVTPWVPKDARHSVLGRAAGVAAMFGFTCFGWLIFREVHFDRLIHDMTLSPLGGSRDHWVAATVMLTVTLACAAPLVAMLLAERYVVPILRDSPWRLPARTTAWALYAAGIFFFFRTETNAFIYFQF